MPSRVRDVISSGTLAARPAAGSNNHGYLYIATDEDGGTLYRSDGSTWVKSAAGVSAGGASSTLTTKGDLLTRDGAAEARLPVGANGLVLTPDSAQVLGMLWGQVGTAGLADLAVTLAKLAADSVDASKIVDGSVGTAELADLGVTLGKLAADSVDAGKMVDGAVGTVELADLAVTLAKLAADSVDASKIVDGSVGAPELGTAAVTAPKLATQPRARVTHSVAQSIPDTTLTILAFDTERFDTDNIHDTVTNNDRLTCQTAGTYIILGGIRFASNATGYRQVRVYKNTTIISYTLLTTVSGNPTAVPVATLTDMAVGDFVQIRVTQSSGGALDVEAANQFTPEFMMIRIDT